MMRLAVCLLAAAAAQAAVSTTTQWDVRTTGNDTNGGGYDPSVSVPGTDYSQQDSPQYTFTDLVIGGTTTQFTSALNPVVAGMVGNVINITGGSGCTTGRYLMLSQSGGTATMDRSMGTAASTCTAKLGGAFLTLSGAVTSTNENQVINIKAGTYTLTSQLVLDNDNRGQKFIGYGTTHFDDGTKPLVTTATNTTILFSVQFGSVAPVYFRNISFSNTASTRAAGISNGYAQTGITLTVDRCIFDGFSVALDRQPSQFETISVIASEIKNSTTYGIRQSNKIHLVGSYLHDNTNASGAAVLMEGGASLYAAFNVFSGNAFGVYTSTSPFGILVNNTFYNNSQHAIDLTSEASFLIANNIFYGNVNALTVSTANGAESTNAFGNNSNANRTGTFNPPSTYAGDITLTADPFTNKAAGDFSLNNTAGGGAALRQTARPGAFAGGTTTGYLDVGAVQVINTTCTARAYACAQ